jgi:hypothetical protein
MRNLALCGCFVTEEEEEEKVAPILLLLLRILLVQPDRPFLPANPLQLLAQRPCSFVKLLLLFCLELLSAASSTSVLLALAFFLLAWELF